MVSSDHINFAVRQNKAIARKIVFETLSALPPIYEIGKYRYIGLGASWFGDFVLAHKILSITDMISIEKDQIQTSRAEFNKPYACVNVIHGDSNVVLPNLDLEEKRLLVWLDYDSSITESILVDLSILCQRMSTGSVVIVTVNANKNSLPSKNENDQEFENHVDRLRYALGYFARDLIRQDQKTEDMTTSKYPKFLANTINKHLNRQIRKAGREKDCTVPLLNINYKDGAPMLTFGAVVTRKEEVQQTIEALKNGTTVERMDVDNQISIHFPPLTFKEKSALDQLMPSDVPLTDDAVSQLGFMLKISQVKEYHRFYLYYPLFGEVSI